MLARSSEPDYLKSFDNLGVHLLCPLFMIADYIMFSEPGKLKKYDPFIFTAVPMGYFLQATILGLSGVNYSQEAGEILHFPYFFVDYYKTGGWVAMYAVVICAAYIGLGFLMWFIDYKRAKRASINTDEGATEPEVLNAETATAETAQTLDADGSAEAKTESTAE
jgi:hypothetical protein